MMEHIVQASMSLSCRGIIHPIDYSVTYELTTHTHAYIPVILNQIQLHYTYGSWCPAALQGFDRSMAYQKTSDSIANELKLL